MADKNFTWMHSGQIGAKQMNGAAGSNGQMLEILDQALITGFNTKTVLSATNTATSVTLTYAAAHGYEPLQLVIVSGATDVGFNGKHRIISKTDTTITIDAAGVVLVTGTITTSIAPLDWQSIFGSTEPLKRAYRSKQIQSSQTVLYLDMSLPTGHGYDAANPAKRAMVSMCEDMTTLGAQINSYTDVRNNYAARPNGSLFWYQCRNSGKTAAVSTVKTAPWIILGNDEYFIFIPEWQDYERRPALYRDLFFFGDIKNEDGSRSSNNCLWLGCINDNDVTNAGFAQIGSRVGFVGTINNFSYGFFIKSYSGTGGLDEVTLSHDATNTNMISGHLSQKLPYPNTATQSLLVNSVFVLSADGLRVRLPRIHVIPQKIVDGAGAAGYSRAATLDTTIDNNVLLVAMHSEGQRSLTRDYGFLAVDIGG